jgi:serine/threonine-protein kinase HipA
MTCAFTSMSKANASLIEPAGFSDVERADNPREVIGRSELLANPDKGN